MELWSLYFSSAVEAEAIELTAAAIDGRVICIEQIVGYFSNWVIVDEPYLVLSSVNGTIGKTRRTACANGQCEMPRGQRRAVDSLGPRSDLKAIGWLNGKLNFTAQFDKSLYLGYLVKEQLRMMQS